MIILGYVCRAKSEKDVLNWEHVRYEWVSVEEALTYDLSIDGRYFMQKYYQETERV